MLFCKCFVAIEFQAIFCNILHSRSLHCWHAVATSRHGFPFLTAKNLGAWGKTGANTIEVAWTPPVKEVLTFSLGCCISCFFSSWFGSRLVNVGQGYLAESTDRKSQKKSFGKPHRCLDGGVEILERELKMSGKTVGRIGQKDTCWILLDFGGIKYLWSLTLGWVFLCFELANFRSVFVLENWIDALYTGVGSRCVALWAVAVSTETQGWLKAMIRHLKDWHQNDPSLLTPQTIQSVFWRPILTTQLVSKSSGISQICCV